MKLEPKPPATLVVRDVMQEDIVPVEPSMTLRELAQVLTSMRISGAPVVDERGEVVGVVSMTDLVTATLRPDIDLPPPPLSRPRFQGPLQAGPSTQPPQPGSEDAAEEAPPGVAGSDGHREPSPLRLVAPLDSRRWNAWFQDLWEEHSVLESVLLDHAVDCLTVEDIMTPLVYCIRDTESLTELVELMEQARIHRVLVTDGTGIVGIVTTMDLIRVIPRLMAR